VIRVQRYISTYRTYRNCRRNLRIDLRMGRIGIADAKCDRKHKNGAKSRVCDRKHKNGAKCQSIRRSHVSIHKHQNVHLITIMSFGTPPPRQMVQSRDHEHVKWCLHLSKCPSNHNHEPFLLQNSTKMCPRYVHTTPSQHTQSTHTVKTQRCADKRYSYTCQNDKVFFGGR
jgi:hypothetical protein